MNGHFKNGDCISLSRSGHLDQQSYPCIFSVSAGYKDLLVHFFSLFSNLLMCALRCTTTMTFSFGPRPCVCCTTLNKDLLEYETFSPRTVEEVKNCYISCTQHFSSSSRELFWNKYGLRFLPVCRDILICLWSSS